MKKITMYEKKQIYGGLSFWTFAMGASLIWNILSQSIGGIIRLVNGSQNTDVIENRTYNNSWLSSYNQYNPMTSPLLIRFGMTPGNSTIMTTLPIGF